MSLSKNLSKLFLFAICSLIFSMGTVFAQGITVTGKVIDSSGQPIVGAYIVVQGTTVGTPTDMDGNYSIEVSENGVLEFSSMGYKSVIVEVKGKKKIDVTLRDDALLLSDAVVVGFGTQRKENLTGAIASVDVGKTLQARPIADVSRGLQGVVPGLTVSVGSAEVGADAVLKIRGQVGSAEGGNSPLILLDNVEIPNINLVNPEDIESISVLKDAASASIYGSKAAFGVILITSKKGAESDGIVNVSYSGNVAFQSMAKNYEMGGVDALRYTVEASERVGKTTPTGAFWLIDRSGYEAAVAWDKKYGKTLDRNDPFTYGRDWYVDDSNRKIGIRTFNPYDYLIEKCAPTHSHNISLSGSSKRTSYNASVGYLDQSGMMKTAKHDDFRRWNASARVSSQVNKFVNVHAALMFSRTQKRYAYVTSATSADVWYYMFRWGPTFPLVAQDEFGHDLRNATYETAAANTATRTINYTSANAGVTITPVKNWNINFDYTYANDEFIHNQPGYKFVAGDTWGAGIKTGETIPNEWNEFNKLGDTIPQYVLNNHQYTANGSNPDHIYRTASNSGRSTINLTTTYDLNIKDAHKLNFMLGMNAIKYDYAAHWTRKSDLMDKDNPQFGLTQGAVTEGNGSEAWESQLGFFGRINYNFKERYLLEANLRYDGTSKFPTQMQWRWYPSFSAGWRVMEESWMQWAKPVVSSLKIRGSWGMIGDQSVSNSLYVPTMGGAELDWIQDGSKLIYYGTPAAVSDNITWQDIVNMDFGFDARFLNGDLGVSFDWFQRDTKNMIVPAEGVSHTFGANAPKSNYGSLRTKGWELALDYGHKFENGLTLTAGVTVSDAKTKITAYGSTKSIDAWYVGKTYGEIWGYETVGLFGKDDFVYDNGELVTIQSKDGFQVYQPIEGIPTQGKLQNSSDFKFGPGDVRFKDKNGDGVINDGSRLVDDHGDLKVIGNSTPRYEYGINLGLNYAGFDVSVFFQGVGQRNLWGNSSMTIPGYNTGDGAMAQAIAGDFWIEDVNENARYPRAFNNANSNSTNNMQVQSGYLLDMSYFRMKNLTVGYTFPAKLMRKALISKLRIYAALENFLTFDHLHGLPIDPEEIPGYSVYNSSNYNGGRTGVGVPAFKTASLGIQLNF